MRLSALSLLLVFFPSCHTRVAPVGISVTAIEPATQAERGILSLLSGTWQLTALRGEPVSVSGTIPTMDFNIEEGQVTGTTGCNRFVAQLLFSEDHPESVNFRQIGATKAFCPDYALENEYLSAMNHVASFVVSMGDNGRPELSLYSQEHNLLLTLRK